MIIFLILYLEFSRYKLHTLWDFYDAFSPFFKLDSIYWMENNMENTL